MLGRLVLLLLQVVIGWFGANAAMGYISFGGEFRLLIFAVVAAIVVFLVGVVAAQLLREVPTPTSTTLSWALIVALIAAVAWTLGPKYLRELPWNMVRPAEYAVLAGAILGYMIKR